MRIARRPVFFSFVLGVSLLSCSSSNDEAGSGGSRSVAGVVVHDKLARVVEGGTFPFRADAHLGVGLGYAHDVTFVWTSSNPEVATIDRDTGLATALKPGTTQINVSGGGKTDPLPATLEVLPAETKATVSAGQDHWCGLTRGGEIACDQYLSTNAEKGFTATPLHFTTLASGAKFSIALTAAGQAYAWGDNRSVLTDFPDPPSPIAVATSLTFAKIAAGADHVLALTADGTLYAWGSNEAGQLGDGTTNARTTAALVAADLKFKEIAAGSDHSLAITTDGALYAWGSNAGGCLGNGTTTRQLKPVAVTTKVPFVSIAAGAQLSAGLTADGNAYAWGAAGAFVGKSATTPTAVPGSVPLKSVSVGDGAFFALDMAGKLYRVTPSGPVAVPIGTAVEVVSAGRASAIALGKDGRPYAIKGSMDAPNVVPPYGAGSVLIALDDGLAAIRGSSVGAAVRYRYGGSFHADGLRIPPRGDIALAVDKLPSGVTVSFAPPTIRAGHTTSLVTMTASASATAGSFVVPMTLGDDVVDTTLVVVEPPPPPPPSKSGASCPGSYVGPTTDIQSAVFCQSAWNACRTQNSDQLKASCAQWKYLKSDNPGIGTCSYCGE